NNLAYKNPNVRRLRFLLKDICIGLEKIYLKSVIEALKKELESSTSDIGRIRTLTGLLVTDLLDCDWNHETLHSWAWNLISEKHDRSFSARIDFMFEKFLRKPQSFLVHLRITGNPELGKIK